jgi:hypothetical protein
MGDIADYLIDNIMDDDEYYTEPSTVTCKYCNKESLHWEKLNNKWRLFEIVTEKLSGGCISKIHVCTHKEVKDEVQKDTSSN